MTFSTLLLYSLFVAATFLVPIEGQSQDWKALYDEAVTHFQSEQYPQALAKAQQAFPLSQSLDPKNQAYTIQLITAICIENNLPDEGLKWIDQETALYKTIEGVKSKTYSEALRKHALLLQQKGKLKEADQKCVEALAAMKDADASTTLSYATMTAFHGQLLVALGNLVQAKEVLTAGLDLLVKQPDAGEDYIYTLSLSAQIDKRLNDLPPAEKKYKQLIDLLEKNNLTQLPEYGDAKSALAEIELSLGKAGESQKLLEGDAVHADTKAQQFLKIAVDHQNKNELEKAAENYALASTAAKNAGLRNNTAFSIHVNYTRVLTELGHLPEATTELALAAELARQLYPPYSAEAAFVDFAAGDLKIKQNDLTAAIDSYKKGLLNSTSLPIALRVRFLTNAAKLLLNENQSEAAVAMLQPIMAGQVNSSDPILVEPILTYCEALIASNQNEQAITILSKAIVTAPNLEVKNKYEIELAEALENKGEWKKAIDLLQAVDLTPSLSGELRASNSFRMAKLQQRLGNYTEAEKQFRAAIDAYRSLQPGRPEELLFVYNSLAIFYTQLGNYTEAERLYLYLLKQTDTFSGFYATLQQNLAAVYVETLRYKDAQALLEKVLEQDKARLGERHPDYAVSLQNLAATYQKTNDLEPAKELYSRALQIDRDNGSDQSLNYATKAANLGVVFQESGDLDKAQALLESALAIRSKLLGKEHPDYVFNEYNLAVIHQQKGNVAKAEPLFRHVADFYLHQIRELFPAMSEKEKAAFYNKISEVILAYQDFAIENGNKNPALLSELYNFRLATKALLLNASTKVRNRILSSGDAGLLQRFAEWLQVKEELGKLYTLNAEQRELNKNKIVALQQRGNELEKQLSAQSELFARDQSQEIVDWQKIKSRLAPDEAAVEMIRLQMNLKNDSIVYVALVVKSTSSQPEMIIFPNGRAMEGREFSFYRNSIRFQMGNDRSYNVYWKPLEKSLASTKTLYFSADGVYNKVNILTFFNPQTNLYLLEQFNIKLVTNTRELLASPKGAASVQTASLFGYPDYTMGFVASQPASKQPVVAHPTRAYFSRGVPELPGTKEEVDRISELLRTNKWATTLFTGAGASEAAIKAQQNTGVLHVATHGFFIPSADEDQPVVVSQDPAQAENNPLLRSGLILSGAEKYLSDPALLTPKAEDGVLTAYEAINLNLDRTDLVVLSACETGSGEIRNGEGVYGLQRAFLLAGANNILMSLWKVDDAATQELMVEFYNQWTKTKNKSIAFRNTQLLMKKKYDLPFYWGSFVMIGVN